MIFYGQCISANITIPYANYEIPKSEFGVYVVLIDVVVIFCFYFFLEVLWTRSNEYIDEFNLQAVKMSDFTIRVKNLPPDMTYGDNESFLRAWLWEHFSKVLV